MGDRPAGVDCAEQQCRRRGWRGVTYGQRHLRPPLAARGSSQPQGSAGLLLKVAGALCLHAACVRDGVSNWLLSS